jgi:DNA-binding transcriptional ArsR family regulator
MVRKRVESETYRYTAKQVGERVDPVTGEVSPILELNEPVGPKKTGRPANTRTRARKGRVSKVTKRFAYVDAESMSMLDLTRQEWRVFQYMIGMIDQGTNTIRVTGVFIAKSIGMTQANVSKTLKALKERNIIIQEDHGVYRINSWIAWTGSYEKWFAATGGDDEPYWTQAELDKEREQAARPALSVVE